MILKHQISLYVSGLILLFVFAPFLVGCQDNGYGRDLSFEAENALDSEFDAGANRPPSARTLYSLARILGKQGKEPQKELVLRRLIKRHPRFRPAYNNLAELYVRHRRIDDALSTLTAGLKASQKDPVLLNNLGMCWILKGNHSKALSWFAEAAGINPNNPRYRANLAAALGMMGRYEESLSIYLQILPASEAHHNIGVLYEAREDFARAAAAYKLSGELAHKPGNGETPNGYVQVHEARQ